MTVSTGKVLFIDDDDALRVAAVQGLELAGFEVAAFDNGPAALKALSRDFPGVVVSDVRMEAPQAEAEEAAAPFDLQGRRVLLVDDHPVNRKVVGVMLAPFGCVVVEAEHGQAALDRLETDRFDVVLMDVNMPVMDGLEATRRLRRDPRWAGLPVIALTADVMEPNAL